MARNKVALEFGSWEPDAALLNGQQAPEAKNCIPAKRGYRPCRGVVALQFPALSEQVKDGFSKRNGEDLITVTATAGGLYALEGGDWVQRFAGSGVTQGRELCDYGNSIYALFGTQLLKADLDGGTLGEFKEVEAAPNAEVMGVVRDFLVLGRLSDYQSGLHWSAIDDPTNWPAIGTDEAQYVQSDRQIFPVGGRVQAIVGGVGGVDGLVFLESAIQRMTYVGTPYIFQFDSVDRERGLLAPKSPVVAGNLCFYLSEDGWRVTDGGTVKGIGLERIDQWFFEACESSRVGEVRGVHDVQNRLALWTFPSPIAPDGVHDCVLIYNYAVDKWSWGATNTECIFPDYARGLTLEDLDAFGPLDGTEMPSLDSPAFKNGKLGVSVFDTAHKLGKLEGEPLEAVIDTAEQGGDRMFLHGFRPLVDSGAAEAMPLFRSRQQDARKGGKYSKQQRDGVCYQHLSSVYLAARIRIPAGETWRNAVGVEALVEAEGGM
jgi:hypothetical protein